MNEQTLDFAPGNKEILEKTLKALGHSFRVLQGGVYQIQTPAGNTILLKDGKATGNIYEVAQLRKSYSQTVVAQSMQWAKEKGWSIQKKSDNKIEVFKGRQ